MESREVSVLVPAGALGGTLEIPQAAAGLILFAHGSGSSRFSPRNRYVAARLHEFGFGTFLFDLLTESEERIDMRTAHLRFDISLLADRLVTATRWVTEQHRLPVGYFGASTGGGAALVAASRLPDVVRAVVSRGGRPDLAGPALPRVKAPTLLIVGAMDREVIQLNRQALGLLEVTADLVLVPRAGHLFEEPGALGQVGDLAAAWFDRFLSARVDVKVS